MRTPRPSLVTSAGGPVELAQAARLAEEAGFESVWATEFYDRSATIALAAMAEATERIELGSAIAYAFGGRSSIRIGSVKNAAEANRRMGLMRTALATADEPLTDLEVPQLGEDGQLRDAGLGGLV